MTFGCGRNRISSTFDIVSLRGSRSLSSVDHYIVMSGVPERFGLKIQRFQQSSCRRELKSCDGMRFYKERELLLLTYSSSFLFIKLNIMRKILNLNIGYSNEF